MIRPAIGKGCQIHRHWILALTNIVTVQQTSFQVIAVCKDIAHVVSLTTAEALTSWQANFNSGLFLCSIGTTPCFVSKSPLLIHISWIPVRFAASCCALHSGFPAADLQLHGRAYYIALADFPSLRRSGSSEPEFVQSVAFFGIFTSSNHGRLCCSAGHLHPFHFVFLACNYMAMLVHRDWFMTFRRNRLLWCVSVQEHGSLSALWHGMESLNFCFFWWPRTVQKTSFLTIAEQMNHFGMRSPCFCFNSPCCCEHAGMITVLLCLSFAVCARCGF